MVDSAILVTGASSGIGEAIARHFDGLGWQVFAGVRRSEDGERLAASSTRVEPLIIDVTDDATIAAAIKTIGDRPLTAVVNNAGIGIGGPIEYVTSDQWRRQFEVNVVGQVAVTRAALPLIRRAGRAGRIVFIGSIGGRSANPMLGPYSASKFALEGIAEALRHELHPWGIGVVLIEPGAIKTPMWDKGRVSADEIEAQLPPEGLERYGDAIASVRKAVDFLDSRAIGPDAVARAVERAVRSSRPAPRKLVGTDAKVTALLASVLPDRVRDAANRALFRFATR